MILKLLNRYSPIRHLRIIPDAKGPVFFALPFLFIRYCKYQVLESRWRFAFVNPTRFMTSTNIYIKILIGSVLNKQCKSLKKILSYSFCVSSKHIYQYHGIRYSVSPEMEFGINTNQLLGKLNGH